MKKCITILTIALTCFCLCSCGTKEESSRDKIEELQRTRDVLNKQASEQLELISKLEEYRNRWN